MKLEDLRTLFKSLPIIIAFILYLIFRDGPDDSVEKELTEDTPTVEYTQTEQIDEPVISLANAEKKIGKEAQQASYVSINDGDTFSVKIDGKKQKIRLLMIDTPEMNYDKGEPMPYAEEAKQYTSDVLKNAKTIEVLTDKGPETDKYDRVLAYVFVDGISLQEMLLNEGLAAVRYVNAPNNTLEQQLRDVQKQAEKQAINIWSLEGYFENNRFDESNIN